MHKKEKEKEEEEEEEEEDPPVHGPAMAPGLDHLGCQVLRGPADCPGPVSYHLGGVLKLWILKTNRRFFF